MKHILSILPLALITVINGFGQPEVTGRVVDAKTGKPIKDAVVFVEGKDLETKTNILGYFQLTADSTQYLIIQNTDYERGKVKVPASGRFLVKLMPYNTPEYEGGMDEFYKFLAKELRYPDQARRMGFEGTIYISFDLDSLKGIQNFVILHDIGSRLHAAEEIIKVLKKVPNKWTPQTRKVTMILPVKLILDFSKPPRPEEFTIPPGKLLKDILVTSKGGLEYFRRRN